MSSLILHVVTRSDTVGGVHAHILTIIKSVMLPGVRQAVIVGDSVSKTFINRLQALGIDYFICTNLVAPIAPLKDIRAVAELVSLFGKLRPSLVHIHSSKAGITARCACLVTQTPCIFTCHGWSFSARVSWLHRFIYFLLERMLSHIALKTVCVSLSDYNTGLAIGIPSSRLSLIHNTGSISTDSLTSTCEKTFSSDTVSILTVARFDHQKDYFTLMQSLAALPPELNWHLTAVGDGPLFNSVVNYSSSLGIFDRITFTGFRQDVSLFYSRADIFILPTNWEGLPITIIDALSASLPVIAADVGGIKELVFHDFNGYLYTSLNRFSLTNRIKTLAQDKDQRILMGKRSRLIYSQYFSPDLFKHHHESLYKGVL